MLRAAIVEKSKEHREYIRASLTGINMDIQVSEYADEYDYLDDLNEEASSFDILLLNTTIHREGDGLELAAKVRARSRKVMICFITDSQRYYAEAFSLYRKDRLWRSLELKNARTEAGTTTRRFLD